MIGRDISHFRILDKIGEGAMGVVYKAEDTALRRTVALKFLTPHLAQDGDLRARFLREAQSAASLNHPNICTVHEIDSVNGFIAMEFVEGETLAAKIKRRPLPIEEALDIAIQTSQGLQAAHLKNVVHRDVKPGNLMVTADGQVKVMDFGLAQAADRSRLTKSAVTVGTPTYMSPEQAQGKPVDERSDLWSLGVVLYEMIAGRVPDTGFLYADPEPLTAVRAGLPMALDRIASKLLAKDPAQRYQHTADLLVDLRAVKVTPKPIQTKSWWPKVAAAVAGIALVAGAVWWAARREKPPPQYRLTQLTRDSGLTMDPSLSADGKLLAFASDRSGDGNLDIWVKHVPGGEPIRLTRDPAVDERPSLSPDGSQIVFHSERDGGGIYIVPSLGGPERLLVRRGFTPQWSPDGKWIAYSTSLRTTASSLRLIPPEGGAPREINTGGIHALNPVWSPDSKRLLFWGTRDIRWLAAGVVLWTVPVEGGAPIAVQAKEALQREGMSSGELGDPYYAMSPVWLAGDHLVMAGMSGDSARLWRVAFSPETGQIHGTPLRLMGGTVEAQPTAAIDGRLAFSTFQISSDMWFLPMDTGSAAVRGPARQLTQDLSEDLWPTVTNDGRKLVFASNRGGNFDVWLRDLETGADRPLTATPLDERRGIISPDGTRVAFNRSHSGMVSLYLMPISGGAEQKLCQDCSGLGWSGDGKRVLYWQGDPIREYTVDVESGKHQMVLRNDRVSFYAGGFSPDDRWISFCTLTPSELAFQWSLMIAPVRNGEAAGQSEWTEIENAGWSCKGRWSPDQSVLYFLSLRDGHVCLWAVRLNPVTGRPAGDPFAVYHLHQARHVLAGTDIGIAVAKDGIYFSQRERRSNIWLSEPQ
ncbi:MAG: PD40 domain-containing protein [Acidobacteriia bacterium]|nr:PD40 domain-containing protein [Terriglobia bacterium]